MTALTRLASIGSPKLAGELAPEAPAPLMPLLSIKNGFFALESALLVRPWTQGPGCGPWWNNHSLWAAQFQGAADGLTFFAEDLFGFQFAVGPDGVYSFDSETAERELLAADVEGWAERVLVDPDFMTGAPLAHNWQVANGPLAAGQRLAPAIPFFLGGKFDVDQLGSLDDLRLMRFRADLYVQVRDLPDGAEIQLEVL